MLNHITEYFFILLNALASLAIFVSVIRLYEDNHTRLTFGGRIFLAAIAASAIYSVFEILAWRRGIPAGMSAFLVLLAVAWTMRAFAPVLLYRILPLGMDTVNRAPHQAKESASFSVRDTPRAA